MAFVGGGEPPLRRRHDRPPSRVLHELNWSARLLLLPLDALIEVVESRLLVLAQVLEARELDGTQGGDFLRRNFLPCSDPSRRLAIDPLSFPPKRLFGLLLPEVARCF